MTKTCLGQTIGILADIKVIAGIVIVRAEDLRVFELPLADFT